MPIRIQVDESYAAALGRAVYVFSYLEWGVAWTGDALKPGFLEQSVKLTAGQIAREFKKVVEECGREPDLVVELAELAQAFIAAADRRNDLIHSTPHTASDGEQRLLRQKKQLDWTTEAVTNLTEEFEALALGFNSVFHKRLEVTVQG